MNQASVLGSGEKARIRRSLIRRDGTLCYYCQVEMILPVEGRFTGITLELEVDPLLATIDHKIPRCRGGRKTLDNLVLCCNRCNKLKGHMTEEEFRSDTPRFFMSVNFI